MSEAMPKAIDYYVKADSTAPFIEWFEKLSIAAQARIRSRLVRVASGNLGKVRPVGHGVHELKFKDRGFSTYRIYFGNDGITVIVLLLGGDKSNQEEDIKLAREYWDDYKKNK